jgi:serine/threonine-protein kinase SRPK1
MALAEVQPAADEKENIEVNDTETKINNTNNIINKEDNNDEVPLASTSEEIPTPDKNEKSEEITTNNDILTNAIINNDNLANDIEERCSSIKTSSNESTTETTSESQSSDRLRRVSYAVENKDATVRQPDPVSEVCDIQVKIADLGNACWVVSL